ncbi:ATP-binding protein [Sphaerisporangium sp. NPDC049002]|uniref:ATP-binding protein n=1 Tax=Sphaerisporangium sp. NPDC049002 TaxID=3155392 RepID=UPI0033C50A39
MTPDTLKEIRLPSDPESAARARAEVRDWLGAEHPAYEPVRLAVSELVTNALRHARHQLAGAAHGPAVSEPLVLQLSAHDDRLRVEVRDTGLAAESPRGRTEPAFLLAEGGRGLAIVDMLSGGRWDFRSNPDGPGWTVRCEIPAAPSLTDEPGEAAAPCLRSSG